MATRSAVIRVEPDLAEAFNSAPKPAQERAKAAMRRMLRIVPERINVTTSRLSKKESELFLKINRNLSDERQRRYDELTEKRLDGKLAKDERLELGELIKEIERIWADRLQAVAELARLRKVSTAEMIKQLELEPSVEIP